MRTCLFGLMLLSLGASGATITKAFAAPRVLVIGLDGARGDVVHQLALHKNRSPALKELMTGGSFAACPRAGEATCALAHQGARFNRDYLWKTGPGWGAVVTGLDTPEHRLKTNDFHHLRLFAEVTRQHPTFFKLARNKGLATAAGGTSSFLSSTDDRRKPQKYDDGISRAVVAGVVDFECGIKGDETAVEVDAVQSCNLTNRLSLAADDKQKDSKLSAWMLAQIRNPEMKLIMGVFDDIDRAGHDRGFDANPVYEAAIEKTDAFIGTLVAEIRKRTGEEWLVAVTSDHGGHSGDLGGNGHDRVAGRDDQVVLIFASFGTSKAITIGPKPSHLDVYPAVADWLQLRAASPGR